MIAEGCEWQARALSAAAEEEAGRFRAMGENGYRRATYCQGVADVLLLLVGDLAVAETTSELSAIMRAYSDSL